MLAQAMVICPARHKSLLVLPFTFSAFAPKEGFNLWLAGVPGPIRRCPLPEDIFQIRSGAAFDE